MISPQDFVRCWGEEQLVRFDSTALEGISIADEAKRFLVEAGLPRRAPFSGGAFTLLPPANPMQAQAGCETFGLLEKVGGFRLLAVTPYRLFIAIDERRQGRIVRTDESGLRRGNVYFMNSSVPQLAESLLAYRAYRLRFAGSEDQSEEEHQPLVAWLEREIGRIDPEAMTYTVGRDGERRGGYWPVNMADYGF